MRAEFNAHNNLSGYNSNKSVDYNSRMCQVSRSKHRLNFNGFVEVK